MNFENQLIFFFSALGAFNGFLLSLYFALKVSRKKFSNYFLTLLVLMLSIRSIKSVFFHFNPQLSGVFIQIGLSALILIGPFLYLYLKSLSKNNNTNWLVHILPFLVGITVLGILYPYVEHRNIWSKWIVKGINFQWLIYIVLSFKYIKPSLEPIWERDKKLRHMDFWLLSVFFGVFIVWLAYKTIAYTSYIVGALSFSFILYLIVLLLIFKYNKKSSFFQEKEKYKSKEMSQETITLIEKGIASIKENELFLNPNLTLANVAEVSKVSKHNVSQYLNEKVGKSFTSFINDLRIQKAKELLQSNNNYTIDSLGYESGFNSKSTFYTTFKKITGITPAEYRKSKGL